MNDIEQAFLQLAKRIETCVTFLMILTVLAVGGFVMGILAFSTTSDVGQQVQTLTAMHGAMGGE